MKKYPKTFAALVLAAALLAQVCVFADAPARNANNLRDISQGDWYYPYVARLYADGVINGVSESAFAPNAEVKTSELSALIARYLGLEYMAEKSRDFLIRNGREGAELWYSGYIQLMCDLGIFGEAEQKEYAIAFPHGAAGGVAISELSAGRIDSPVLRMDVAKFIAKSFEIEKGRTKTNFLKSEIGGNGNEFISGGGYDMQTLAQLEERISDWADIPEGYGECFLKCYYNGIIRGNERGEVLAQSRLKRSELARIIASVLYFELRGDDIRELPEACAINIGDFAISPADGSRVLKGAKAVLILGEQAENIKTEADKETLRVDITQENIIPAGYLCEIYLSVYENGNLIEIGRQTCATNKDEYFPKQGSWQISLAGKPVGEAVGQIYMVLRDLCRGGEVAGAVSYQIGTEGGLKYISAYNLP
ncbi:MAG: S-layer homology domain-containing protein [Oscillospiraceae bacterium]|nr:S-layer homology domain-containing protein [Oscillospiraceae bacterium]